MQYITHILDHNITFSVGLAGTGKAYLTAVDALERQEIHRILLTSPAAVESGDKLGFLPRNIRQKFDAYMRPYMRPLYDALFKMLGFWRAEKLIESNVIEVALLAYMLGRTLNHDFIFFHSEDMVHHQVIARIVNSNVYEAWEHSDQKRKYQLVAERKCKSLGQSNGRNKERFRLAVRRGA